jgi:hypothetical protein
VSSSRVCSTQARPCFSPQGVHEAHPRSRQGIAELHQRCPTVRIQPLFPCLHSHARFFKNRLGSSVGLLSSAFHLRARLSQILHLFRENAAELFRDVLRQSVEPTRPLGTRKRRKPLRPTQKMRPDITIRSDPEALPEELDFLATDLHTFLECLNQIPEFTDEGVNSTALSFHNDLKYWASGLQEYKGEGHALWFQPLDSSNPPCQASFAAPPWNVMSMILRRRWKSTWKISPEL